MASMKMHRARACMCICREHVVTERTRCERSVNIINIDLNRVTLNFNSSFITVNPSDAYAKRYVTLPPRWCVPCSLERLKKEEKMAL